MSSTRTGSAVWRMTIAYLSAFILCMIFVAWVVTTLLGYSLLKQLDNRLLTVGTEIMQTATTPAQAQLEVKRRAQISDEFLFRVSGATTDSTEIIPQLETGCSSFETKDMPHDGEQGDAFRACAINSNGFLLTVASDIDAIEDTATTIQAGLLGSTLLALLFALATVRHLTRHYLLRLDKMRMAAITIADGNFETRLPVSPQRDEFDRVAESFNFMLSRKQELIEAHKHVGSAIAHDIRTPLTRLKNLIDTNQRALGPELATQLTEDVDGIIALSASLLRLAEIDNTSDKRHWRTFDFAEEAKTIVEAFEPSFADVGKSIKYIGADSACVHADQGLLQQLAVNLIENALRHTSGETRVEVSVTKTIFKMVLDISDNGPGLSAQQIQRIEQPFFKAHRSSNSTGHGLGLALVAAIARHHNSTLVVQNLLPGLSVSTELPLASVIAV